MHNNRSSHSFLPSLCSLQTFIGLAVILCVYFTLQSSISLHEKSLPSQQIQTVSLRSSFAQPRRIEEEESPPIDEPPPYSYTPKEHIYNTPSSYKEEESPPFDESPPYSYTPKEHIYSTPSISSNKEVESPTIDQSPYSYTPKEHIYNTPSTSSNKGEESPSIGQPPPYSYTQEEQSYTSPPISGNEEENLGGLAEYFDISWGDGRGKFHENGSLLTLSLDELSGSGFQSKDEYLFAKIDINIKLISNNSAGTVTTFYMSSNETDHDEIDFEFLGNVSGQPYTVHTNIYSQGKGNREQQFYLWFDPTMDFHSYSILWTPYRIVFFVDGTPIREFENMEKIGVPFPNKQPMRIYSSLWNADDWATQGGRVHTDWSKAPFVASYRNFSSSSCVWSFGTSSCGSDPDSSDLKNAWLMEKLDSKSLEKMRWVQKNYMTYDYCLDKLRFHEGLPKECKYRKSKR